MSDQRTNGRSTKTIQKMMESAMKIKVRRDLCCGAGLCVQIAPEVFRLDDLGYNEMDGKSVPEGQHETAREGASACPESAIALVEEATTNKLSSIS